MYSIPFLYIIPENPITHIRLSLYLELIFTTLTTWFSINKWLTEVGPVCRWTGYSHSPVCLWRGNSHSPVCWWTGSSHSPVCLWTGNSHSPVCRWRGRRCPGSELRPSRRASWGRRESWHSRSRDIARSGNTCSRRCVNRAYRQTHIHIHVGPRHTSTRRLRTQILGVLKS